MPYGSAQHQDTHESLPTSVQAVLFPGIDEILIAFEAKAAVIKSCQELLDSPDETCFPLPSLMSDDANTPVTTTHLERHAVALEQVMGNCHAALDQSYRLTSFRISNSWEESLAQDISALLQASKVVATGLSAKGAITQITHQAAQLKLEFENCKLREAGFPDEACAQRAYDQANEAILKLRIAPIVFFRRSRLAAAESDKERLSRLPGNINSENPYDSLRYADTYFAIEALPRAKAHVLEALQEVRDRLAKKLLISLNSQIDKLVQSCLAGEAGDFIGRAYGNRILLPYIKEEIRDHHNRNWLLSMGIEDAALPLARQPQVLQALSIACQILKQGPEEHAGFDAPNSLRSLIDALPYSLGCLVGHSKRDRTTIERYLKFLVEQQIPATHMQSGQFEGIRAPKVFHGEVLSAFNSSLWELASEIAVQYLGVSEDTLIASQDLISRSALAELLQLHEHQDRTIRLGYTLYAIPAAETVPFALINAFRESGYSGEMPFVSIHSKPSETILYRFIAALSPAQMEQLQELNIPGLCEALALIKLNSDTFLRERLEVRGINYFESPLNPVWVELKGHLSQICLHYLRGDEPAKQFFVMGVLARVQRQPTAEVVSEFARLLQFTTDPKVRKELLDTITECIREAQPAALMVLEELSNGNSRISKSLPSKDKREYGARMFAAFTQGELPTRAAECLAVIFGVEIDNVRNVHSALKLLVDKSTIIPSIPYDASQYSKSAPQFESLLAAFTAPQSLERAQQLGELGYRYNPAEFGALQLVLDNFQEISKQLQLLEPQGKDGYSPVKLAQDKECYIWQPIACALYGKLPHEKAAILTKLKERVSPMTAKVAGTIFEGLAPYYSQECDSQRLASCRAHFFEFMQNVARDERSAVSALNLLEAGALLLTRGVEASELPALYDLLNSLSQKVGAQVCEIVASASRIWPKEAQNAAGLTEFINCILPYCGRIINDGTDLAQLETLITFARRELGERELRLELENACSFAEEFGCEYLPTMYLAWVRLKAGQEPEEDLRSCGVTSSGEDGLRQLNNYRAKLRDKLFERDGTIELNGALDLELLAAITRFHVAQWSSSSPLQITVESFNAACAAGELRSTPAFLQPGHLIIKRLDADQLAAFRFTKPCEERFLQLQSELLSIAHSNSDVLAKERIEDAIREISQRLTELEKPLSPEGADEDKDGRRAAGRKKRAEQLHAFIVMLKKETEITTGSEKLINLLAEFDTGEIPALGSIIRRLTLGRALELVRHSIDLEKLQVAPLSPESLSVMAELMEHVIVKEGLPSFALSSKASKRLKQLFSQRALLDDMARLQGMQTKGMEEWLALPTRGLLAELSGSYSDTCWNSVRQLVKGHPNITAVPFVRSPNTPLAKLIGSTLLIEGRSLEGDQVLIIRGINPLQNHIMRVQAESFFEAFVEWLAPHAKRGGFTKILIPGGKSGGSQTNRPPLHAYIQEKYGNAPVILLADDPPTTFNGYDIRSSCLLVRELTQ